MILDRTFHPDEANQTFTTGRLLDTGIYEYNPQDHHGPTLYYAAAAIQKAAGHDSTATIDGTLLRCTPLVFAALALLFGFLAVRKITKQTWPCILFAILLGTSPIFVFFATDFIQEMLLAAFTMMMFWTGIGYLNPNGRLKPGSWALLFGIAAGLAFATKETSTLTFAAAAISALVASRIQRGNAHTANQQTQATNHQRPAILAISGFLLTATLFYSSFGDNWHGVYNAFVSAPLSYLHRAVGSAASQGAANHVHPCWQYLSWLFGGNVFFLALALIGIPFGFAALAATNVHDSISIGTRRAFLFLATYSIILTALYSAIPYKTPWCALQMHIPILLAAILGTQILCTALCVAGLRRCTTTHPLIIKTIAHIPIVVLSLLIIHNNSGLLSKMWQDPDSKKIPYNYASASPQVKELAKLISEKIDSPSNSDMLPTTNSFAAVALPTEDTWPLPFYLRSIGDRVGYWTSLSELETLSRLGSKPSVVVVPAEEGHLVQPLFPHLKNTKRFEIRPHVRVRVFWCPGLNTSARLGSDSIVRISSYDGLADYAKVPFQFPVKSDWKVLAQTGSGIKAGSAWLPVSDGHTVAWYALLNDGVKTYGFGVKVQPRAMCAWRVEPNKVELLLDLRAGGRPLELGERTLEACEVVRCESAPGESAYATGRRLCSLMCPAPRILNEPMIGFNDWYAAYGRNTATNFLADAAFVVSLCNGAAVQPYVVMDDGWQRFSPPEVERLTGHFDSGYGPWDESSQSFGMDMKTFCAKITALGAKPGLWYRPLCMEGKMCDPSDPDVLSRISADIHRFKDWGFKFIKIDYLTFDWCGHFKHVDETGRLIRDERRWKDSKHTTAETICNLYRMMRDAAGDEMVILGCNAVNHLCAGLFEASRVGPDTSGKNWEQTKRNGVGAIAFKGIENGTFFAADPDCAGLAEAGAIPWEKNRIWIDLLSRSGMPFFISWRRTLADAEVRKELSAAFRRASVPRKTAEAQDWLENTAPCRWLTADGFREYSW